MLDNESNKERLFEYIMRIATNTPNNYELGDKIRDLAIKKGYYYDERKDPEER